MKRLHVHVGVGDLGSSIRFYSTLFGAEPTVTKPDYAKWMLDDPRVNFAISAGHHAAKGIEHLGIQVETSDELGDVYSRLKAADRPVLEEGATTCCYARSEKSWISDPDGIVWETFLTNGEATVYGDSPELTAVSANASGDTCCAPVLSGNSPPPFVPSVSRGAGTTVSPRPSTSLGTNGERDGANPTSCCNPN